MDETQLDPMLKWLRDRSVVLECEQSGRACDEIMALRRNVDQISRERDDWKRTAKQAQIVAAAALKTTAWLGDIVDRAGLVGHPDGEPWPGYDKTGAL